MDDPNEENVEENWVFLNPVDVPDVAEEAISLNEEDISDTVCFGEENLENKIDKKEDSLKIDSDAGISRKIVESDSDSDGISIISESSHMHDNTDEENDEVYAKAHDDQKDEINCVNTNFIAVERVENVNDILVETSQEMSCPPKLVEPIEPEDANQEISEQDVVECIGGSGELEPFLEPEHTNMFENILRNISRSYEDVPMYSGLIVGGILLLLCSIFLAQYIGGNDKLSAEDFALYEQYLGSDSDNFVEGNDDKNFDVSTALTYCKEKHQNDGHDAYRNMNRCLRKIEMHLRRRFENMQKKRNIETIQKQLEKKENFLNEKEKYLAKKEYELNSKEAKINNKNEKRNSIESGEIKSNNKDEVEQINESFEQVSVEDGSDSDDTFQERNEQTKQKKDKKIYLNKNYDGEKKQKKSKNKFKNSHYEDSSEDNEYDHSKDSKYKKYDEKCKFKYDDCKMNNVKYKKDDYRSKEFKYENEDCKDENNCKKYKKYQKEFDNLDDSTDDDEEKEKKHKKLKEYSSKQKRKCKDSSEKHHKDKKSKNKQNQYDYEKSNYKYYNSCKEDRKDKKYDSGTNYVLIDNKNDTNSITGYWVGKLYKARNDLRNKETSGEWYFDRASYRKRKRDKARWYFDWMFDRELMRYKRSVYTDV